MKQGKRWGTTWCLHKNHALELHRIEVKAGGTCSKHRHEHKWNGFFVESGKLTVKIWQPSGDVDETVLGPGDQMEVPPGVKHQFVAQIGTVAFEWYWVGALAEDIIREPGT